MLNMKKLVSNVKFVHIIETKNWTGAASTGDSISLKNYGHCTFIIQTGSWAAGTAAVTIGQDKIVAPSGSAKALAFTEMWEGCILGTDDTLTRTVVTGNTFPLANQANTLYIIEIDAEMLDVSNGFDVLELNIATPGSNNDFYGAIAILSQARFLGETPPSAIIN